MDLIEDFPSPEPESLVLWGAILLYYIAVCFSQIAAKHGKNPLLYGLLSILPPVNLVILGIWAFTKKESEQPKFKKLTEEQYLGIDGRPKAQEGSGIAAVRRLFDERGNQTEERYLDSNGHLVGDREAGIAVVQWKYDDEGNMVGQRFLGTDEKPIEAKTTGTASVSWRYE